jgi:TolA-binding protein
MKIQKPKNIKSLMVTSKMYRQENRYPGFTKRVMSCGRYIVSSLAVIVMMWGISLSAAHAQNVDKTTLGDMQLRIIAIENTLRDLNARVENDLFDLRQNMESGSNAEEVLRRVDEKLNNINNISNELISLNNKIQRTLQIATDNEFRLLQLEAKIQSIMRLSAGMESSENTQDGASALSPDAGSSAPITEQEDAASAEGTDNSDTVSENSSEWALPKSQIEADSDDQISGAANPPATSLEVTSPEPTLPSLLPEGTEIEQYEFAKNLMHENKLAEAEAALIEFDTRYPDSDLSADVNFWIGRVQFVQGEHQRSLKTMTNFIQTWPEEPRRVEVLMWIAESFSVTRPKEESCNFFNKLLLAVEDPPQKLTTRLARLRDKTGCEA